jgi:hypothetical protein
MANGIYAHYLDNHIWDATVTSSVAPLTSYSLDTLKSGQPAARVRWGTGTVTITFTFSGSKTANLLAIPVSNLAGSVLTLTNGAGLSQAITLPTLPADGIPLTAIATFTSSSHAVWNLVISGNAANVILGGCIWLGTYKELDRNFRYSFREIEDARGVGHENEYGTEYLVPYDTINRRFQCSFATSDTGAEQLRLWQRDGRWRPCLFWPDPSVNDAYIGRWETGLSLERHYPNYNPTSLVFRELGKGLGV